VRYSRQSVRDGLTYKNYQKIDRLISSPASCEKHLSLWWIELLRLSENVNMYNLILLAKDSTILKYEA
jgi:hypothetical protein